MSNLTFKCSKCSADLAPDEVSFHICVVGDAVVIPDAVGEIIAWRAWRVTGPEDDPRLQSVTHTTSTWPPRAYMIAACGKHTTEEVPHKTHSCGLYAAKTRSHLLSMTYHRYSEDSDVVIGEVALSGRIIPGTQGWRAQKGRVKKLYVPYERWRLVRPLMAAYGVPVELDNILNSKEEE